MASTVRIPVSSTEYLKVSVTADVTLSAQNVDIAITAARVRPESGGWIGAAWTGTPGQTRIAILLIGPASAHPLTVGDYDIWVRVSDSPEIPTDPAGRLTIY